MIKYLHHLCPSKEVKLGGLTRDTFPLSSVIMNLVRHQVVAIHQCTLIFIPASLLSVLIFFPEYGNVLASLEGDGRGRSRQGT